MSDEVNNEGAVALYLDDDPTPETTPEDGTQDEEVASPEEDSATPDEEEPVEEEKVAQSRSPKFQKLLAKYGGDEDKLADAIFEQYNSASQLHSKIRELETRINTPSKPESPPEDHPDIKALKSDIAAQEQRLQTANVRQQQILQNISQFRDELAAKKGELRRADPDDKFTIQREISDMETRMASLSTEWYSQEDRKGDIQYRQKSLERELKSAERAFQNEQANKSKEDANNQATQAEIADTFKGIALSKAKAAGVEDQETLDYFHNVLRAEAITYLRTPGAQSLDFDKFISQRLVPLLKLVGLGKKTTFTKASTTKLQAAGKPILPTKVPSRSTSPVIKVDSKGVPTFPRGTLTAEQAKAFTKSMLG